jgi:hypothetical protein
LGMRWRGGRARGGRGDPSRAHKGRELIVYEVINRWPLKWDETAPAVKSKLHEEIVRAIEEEEELQSRPSQQEMADREALKDLCERMEAAEVFGGWP